MALTQTQELLLKTFDGLGKSSKFCEAGSLPIVLPGLAVRGLGDVGVPVSEADARRLIESSEQAPYGRGEETILDTDVRRVWQIDAGSVTFANPKWNGFIQTIVERVASAFAIKKKINCELYKLLVYEKGSFFKPHRDTEKTPGMFATLVVALPSKHAGGELIITHQGQTERIQFDAPNSAFDVQFAAFYADCLHEVTPVQSGYRICLVYNLSLANTKQQPSAPDVSGIVPRVQELLPQLFAEGSREQLIIPLEHQYSSEGLSLGVLKGQDSALVEVIARACDAAGFEAHLAALEIMQVGCPEPETYYSRNRYSHWDDDDDEDAEDAEFMEVTDEDWGIECLLKANGEPASVRSLSFREEDVVSKESLEDWPREQSISEATGNAGATLERWYRRTCIVIWEKANVFAVLAKEGPSVAMPTLMKLIEETPKSNESAECRAAAATVLEYWRPFRNNGYTPGENNKSIPSTVNFANALAKIGDVALTKTFITKVLAVECSGGEGPYLVRLFDQSGWKPFRATLSVILTKARWPEHHADALFAAYVSLFESLCCAGSTPSEERLTVCRALAQDVSEALQTWDKAPRDDWRARSLNRELLLKSLINAYAALGEEPRLTGFIKSVFEHPQHYPLHKVLIPAITQLFKAEASNDLHAAAREQLRLHGIGALQELTAAMPQPPSDWSREAKVKCHINCANCKELNAFLMNPTEQSHGFSRVQFERTHLEEQIRATKCDLTFTTVKGRAPHTLLCTKTDATYRRNLSEYHSNTQHLAALEAFAPSSPAPQPVAKKKVAKANSATKKASTKKTARKKATTKKDPAGPSVEGLSVSY